MFVTGCGAEFGWASLGGAVQAVLPAACQLVATVADAELGTEVFAVGAVHEVEPSKPLRVAVGLATPRPSRCKRRSLPSWSRHRTGVTVAFSSVESPGLHSEEEGRTVLTSEDEGRSVVRGGAVLSFSTEDSGETETDESEP